MFQLPMGSQKQQSSRYRGRWAYWPLDRYQTAPSYTHMQAIGGLSPDKFRRNGDWLIVWLDKLLAWKPWHPCSLWLLMVTNVSLNEVYSLEKLGKARQRHGYVLRRVPCCRFLKWTLLPFKVSYPYIFGAKATCKFSHPTRKCGQVNKLNCSKQ